jgi:hypothetical protein
MPLALAWTSWGIGVILIIAGLVVWGQLAARWLAVGNAKATLAEALQQLEKVQARELVGPSTRSRFARKSLHSEEVKACQARVERAEQHLEMAELTYRLDKPVLRGRIWLFLATGVLFVGIGVLLTILQAGS